jgi:hypothetical protein
MAILKFETIKAKNNLKPENTQGYSVTYLSETNSLLLYGLLTTSDVYLFSLSTFPLTQPKSNGLLSKPPAKNLLSVASTLTTTTVLYLSSIESLKALVIHGG